MPSPTLEFLDRPEAFLDAAGDLLAADPVLGSVVATVTEQVRDELAAGRDPWAAVGAGFDRWWVVVRNDAGAVVGAAMRTAPFVPHPAFVLPMPEAAARGLADALHHRGERLGAVNGALPAALVVAEETARLTGGTAVTSKSTRLWEATEVVVPAPPPGRLRPATAADADLVGAWLARFQDEADEQAGRAPRPGSRTGPGSHVDRDDVLARIAAGVVWLWTSPAGEVVHLTGRSRPAYGVSRVGPVLTPRTHRGGGLASYVVGELTRDGLARGWRMCLVTDRANPTSGRVYERLGYRPVVDTVETLVLPP